MHPSPEAPALERLRSKVGRGSLWAVLGYGGGQILRLAGNLVLWRLLYAEAFGLMAIVNVFMLGLLMFSDVGIGPSIIQHEHGDDPKYLHTAWTIQVARGFALFAVAAAAAVPLAHFYQEPALARLIPVVAFSSILSGFNSTKLFTVTRRIALGRLTAIDIGSQAAGLAVMVVAALVTRSIWALVLGGVVTAVDSVDPQPLFPSRRRGPLPLGPGRGARTLALRKVDLREHAAHVRGDAVRPAHLRQAGHHERAGRLQHRHHLGDVPHPDPGARVSVGDLPDLEPSARSEGQSCEPPTPSFARRGSWAADG